MTLSETWDSEHCSFWGIHFRIWRLSQACCLVFSPQREIQELQVWYTKLGGPSDRIHFKQLDSLWVVLKLIPMFGASRQEKGTHLINELKWSWFYGCRTVEIKNVPVFFLSSNPDEGVTSLCIPSQALSLSTCLCCGCASTVQPPRGEMFIPFEIVLLHPGPCLLQLTIGSSGLSVFLVFTIVPSSCCLFPFFIVTHHSETA